MVSNGNFVQCHNLFLSRIFHVAVLIGIFCCGNNILLCYKSYLLLQNDMKRKLISFLVTMICFPCCRFLHLVSFLHWKSNLGVGNLCKYYLNFAISGLFHDVSNKILQCHTRPTLHLLLATIICQELFQFHILETFSFLETRALRSHCLSFVCWLIVASIDTKKI